ncbi:hypothetical protein BZG36_02101 [Bifiguratus adelaidae]|uniref:Catalase n=1 Tax=Bifiguratus adelaidae TaxID=1938954 RepID=A0A261Y377_9FUNG|nr:hypothetical protein BZG36_02101 [Bifiguratus adelaidae]
MAPNNNVLTTGNGNPVDNNQTSLTAGPDGPVLIQDFHLIDKLAHFDRERIPERVVHAKGAAAHGYFEVTHDISHLTKAKFLNQLGKRTPVFLRFSTVGGEKGSADTARDPRGFAIKFYTEEGNWDMVGNNTPVFFIRDPSKFPDFIHTQKRNPQTNLADPDAFWDFLSLVPESIHQVTILFSDRGTPDGYRHMNGYSSHTLKLVDHSGKFRYVKWHFKTNQGIKNLTAEQAKALASEDPDYATRDLFNAIEKGDFPSWNAYVQIMEPQDVEKYRFNSFDVTKVWSQKDYPLHPVGRLVLDRNPENYFAETEQAAFSPSHMVPGIDASVDRMLQGRLFSYPDTHRHRLGPNYQQIPINAPKSGVRNQQRDGFMTVNGNGGSAPNYEPNSSGISPVQNNTVGTTFSAQEVRGWTGRHGFNLVDIDFVQAGDLYRLMPEDAKTRLISNIVGHMKNAKKHIRDRQIANFKRADPEYGRRIEEGILKAAALESRQQRSTRRRLVVTDGIDFSSNDFLGLASNTAYRADFLTELTRLGRLGSTGSRLLDGNSREAEELEARMARFHHAETALLFNSGFDANSGFFACVPQSGDTILYDEYIHASVHDGMKVCRAKTRKAFRHNDVQHLRELLMEVHPGNVFIAVETVYSMDGDMAPLEDIVRLKREVWPNGENGYIAVDEAHATGVYGDHGRGVVCALGLEDEIFARLHTFGKALGSTGAVLLGSALLREYLINYARPLIYSTFMPYYTLASIKVAYSWLEFGKTKQYQEHVHHLTAYFRNSVVLSEAKLLPSSSPIQGIIVEGSNRCNIANGDYYANADHYGSYDDDPDNNDPNNDDDPADNYDADADADDNDGSNTNVGAIVGGVIGGVAALALLGGLITCIRKHRKGGRKPANEPFDDRDFAPAAASTIPMAAAGTSLPEPTLPNVEGPYHDDYGDNYQQGYDRPVLGAAASPYLQHASNDGRYAGYQQYDSTGGRTLVPPGGDQYYNEYYPSDHPHTYEPQASGATGGYGYAFGDNLAPHQVDDTLGTYYAAPGQSGIGAKPNQYPST